MKTKKINKIEMSAKDFHEHTQLLNDLYDFFDDYVSENSDVTKNEKMLAQRLYVAMVAYMKKDPLKADFIKSYLKYTEKK